MARPRISEEKLRIINFTIRLTADEHKRLEKAAAVCGTAPGVLVRDKLFRGRFPVPKSARIDLDTYLELKKIGVNLNQLTRLAHLGKYTFKLMGTILRLQQQQEQIISLLLQDDRQSENR